jgi:hypothetical protein
MIYHYLSASSQPVFERPSGSPTIGKRFVPGVELIGPLLSDLQIITVFSAALDAKAQDNEAAKAFVKFISAPAAAAACKAKGLDPG